MPVIALTVHHARAEAVAGGRDVAHWLAGEGHRVVSCGPDADLIAAEGTPVEAVGSLADVDLVIALGGDGTVLRTIDLLAGAPVPVLGVNLGQLGYLTEVEPVDLRRAIADVLAGRHQIEQRMLLEVVLPGGERHLALNEVTIDRAHSGHTVRLDVAIDGRPFTPYEVDALIVGTPTGSTAYGYSAGGPIVAPTHRLLLLTPVSPHMLFDRSLILEPSSSVDITVAGHRPGAVIVDGREVATVDPGAAVRCAAAAEQAHLVVFGPRDFPGLLKAKFKLSDR